MLCRGVLQTPLQIAPYTLLKFFYAFNNILSNNMYLLIYF